MNPLLSNPEFRFIKVQKKNKIPIEPEWQKKNNYPYDSRDIQEWLAQNGNIGVATGYGNLLVVDFDDIDFQEKFIQKLPNTLRAKSGSGGAHLFFQTDNPESFKILNRKTKDTLADIQGVGKQIIVSPSIHPNGKQYQFVNEAPIAFLAIAELKALFREYMGKDKVPQKQPAHTTSLSDMDKPSLSSVLHTYGVDTTKNPTQCPWHHSKGGKCFSFDEHKGVFNCFHCGVSGDVISFVMEEKQCDFPKACKELGIALPDLVENTNVDSGKTTITLTKELRNDPHRLGEIVGRHMRKVKTIFYRPYFDEIVEVVVVQSAEEVRKNRSRVRMSKVNEDRFKNILLSLVEFVEMRKKGKEWQEESVTLNKQECAILIKNDSLLKQFRKLDNVMSRPYFSMSDKGLIVEYKGHSEYSNIYFTPDTPNVELIDVEEAKQELYKLLSGFCFEHESDRAIALSYIITPALRGLYENPRERTPCFALLANRERAGKDYLAGVRSITYTGMAIDNPPIADGERPNVEEWRKKFTTMLMNGENIFHSANNVGSLNNPVFEALITSQVMQDRLLGSNSQKILDNKLDMSFSANIGLRWRGDMSGRLRRINLFYSEEDPNSRTFQIPDLHGYITKNRGRILSCIYTLIKTWCDAGQPRMEDKVFTSFPIWAKFCGGLMDYHKLGDPLAYQEDDELGGNEEERFMAQVFQLVYLWQKNNNESVVKSPQIIEIVEGYQNSDSNTNNLKGFESVNSETMMYLTVTSRSEKLRMGHLLTKYRGRILQGIKFKLMQSNKEAKRRTYAFIREDDSSSDVMYKKPDDNSDSNNGVKMIKVNVAKKPVLEPKKSTDDLLHEIQTSIDSLPEKNEVTLIMSFGEAKINHLLSQGLLVRVRSGRIEVLK